jgi:hypothetical protein
MYPVIDNPGTLDLTPSYVTSGAGGNVHSFTFWKYICFPYVLHAPHNTMAR